MLERLLRSTAFRLTLFYAGLFGGSVAVLLSFIYFATLGEMETQIKTNISTQLADLTRSFIVDGPDEMAATIRTRIEKEKEKMTIYLLLNPKWKSLAGNIDRWPGGNPRTEAWLTFPLYREDTAPEQWPQVLAMNTTLPGGYILLVGYKLTSLNRTREVIIRVILVGIGLSTALAVGGGIAVARTIRRRLDQMNTACEHIMHGQMKERVATTGSGDEFDTLAANFNAMLGRIEELIEGIRDISSNVAHDLRTPLNRIRQRLERLQNHPANEEKLMDELRRAIQDIDGLTQTFNAILRITQAESGTGKEHFITMNLSALLGDIVELYEPLAEGKNIKLRIKIEADAYIFGDRPLLSQAIANLVDNAVKYTPEGGEISVSLKPMRNQVYVWISDSGPGIPEEFHYKVMEKFFRLEKSRHQPGNGLGLSLANAAFKLHGAELQFSDNQPGLKVQIVFPLMPAVIH